MAMQRELTRPAEKEEALITGEELAEMGDLDSRHLLRAVQRPGGRAGSH